MRGTLNAAGGEVDEVEIQIHVFITQNGGTLDNEACVDPDDEILEFSANSAFNPDGNGNNCKTKVTAVVEPKPDMQVTKSARLGQRGAGREPDLHHQLP